MNRPAVGLGSAGATFDEAPADYWGLSRAAVRLKVGGRSRDDGSAMRILHRYILREMAVVSVTAGGAFTAFVCLAMVLAELQDKGLGPVTSLMFMGLAVPFAMYFAIPLGGILATTLIYGRLTAEREVQACRASGIPLASLFWPAAILAVAAGALHLSVTAWPLPTGRYEAEKLAFADMERYFFAQLVTNHEVKDEKKQLMLTVDRIVGDILYGATLRYRRQGDRLYVTAPIAKVEFDANAREAVVTLWDAVIIEEAEQVPTRGNHKVSLNLPKTLPRKVGHLTLPQLVAAQEYPASFSDLLTGPGRDELSEAAVKREKQKVRARAMAEFHWRVAMAVGCAGLILLGAALGLLFHSGHILTAFGVAILPALTIILGTELGASLASEHLEQPAERLYLIWLPNAGAVALAAAAVGYVLAWWARPRTVLRRAEGKAP